MGCPYCVSVYIRSNQLCENNVGNLRQLLEEENFGLASWIMYHGLNLRGTGSYREHRCSELVAMVGHVLHTFCSDYH